MPASTGWRKYGESPIGVRAIPFVVFALLTVVQGARGGSWPFWWYLAKTMLGAVLIGLTWRRVEEMRWRWSWEAVVVGVVVFALWVGLDPYLPRWKRVGAEWDPVATFGAGSALAAGFMTMRVAGMSLVVPLIEEVFYRSLLYRYLVSPDPLSVSFRRLAWRPLVVTALVFGVSHNEWVSGILCGLLYQGLVLRRGRLGDAVTAHSITNLLLGLWVVWKGAWHFW